jgi:WD40 repeat protein
VDGYSSKIAPLAFGPRGRWLVTPWTNDDEQLLRYHLRLWPVGQDGEKGPRILELPEPNVWWNAGCDPGGRYVFVVGLYGRAYVVPLDGSPPRRLEGFSHDTLLLAAAVSPSGRQVATAFGWGAGEKALRVWDLDAGEVRRFDLPESVSGPTPGHGTASAKSPQEQSVLTLAFVGESTLYSGGDGGIRRWNLTEGTHELVFAARPGYGVRMELDAEGRTALVRQTPLSGDDECQPVEAVDIRSGTARTLSRFGDCVHMAATALDPSGTVVATADRESLVRVGRLDGGEPHLLLGHSGTVHRVAISQDRRWVASAGGDKTLRLWPMPDLDKPPLHTLPHEELVARLRSLTNIRAVPDPEAPNGWTIELGPFPGWKEVPEW